MTSDGPADRPSDAASTDASIPTTPTGTPPTTETWPLLDTPPTTETWPLLDTPPTTETWPLLDTSNTTPTDTPTSATWPLLEPAHPPAIESRWKRWGAAAAGVAGVVVFVVLAVIPPDLLLGDDDTADPDPTAITTETAAPDPMAITADGQRVYWEDLQRGMCVREDPNAIDYDYIVVDCSAEHEEEVTSASKLAGSKEYPGEDAIEDTADKKCNAAFASYVGMKLGESRLDVDYLTPEMEDWDHSENTLICLVLDPDHDQITRSLRGAHE